jgi:hypothetical protein
MPVVRERLLAAARATPLLGAETTLELAEVILLDDGVRVRVAVAGFNRVAVDAVFAASAERGRAGWRWGSCGWGRSSLAGALRTKATVGGAAGRGGGRGGAERAAGAARGDRWICPRGQVREQARAAGGATQMPRRARAGGGAAAVARAGRAAGR